MNRSIDALAYSFRLEHLEIVDEPVGISLNVQHLALGAVPVEGISDDESLRKMAAETVKESQTTEFVKMTFEADGTVKNSVKGEDGNYGKEDVGTYKLNGNNLTFTVTADGKKVNVNATVLSLTATELKLQMDAQNALTSGGEDMAKLYKEVLGDFNLIMVETYKRL